VRLFLVFFLLTLLAACGTRQAPSDDHSMSDPLFIMTTAGLQKSLHDVKADSSASAMPGGGSNLGTTLSAANVGFSAALPAAGFTSLAGGLLGGINLLTESPQHVAAEIPWLLVWAPDDGTPVRQLSEHYAAVFGQALAVALSNHLPDKKFVYTPGPSGGDPDLEGDFGAVRFEDPLCHTFKIHCDIRIAQTNLNLKGNPQLPRRFVKYNGPQLSLSIPIQPRIDSRESTGWHEHRRTHWATLEAFVDASRALPPYAWIYIGPDQVAYLENDRLMYVRQPIMLHQGTILRFVQPVSQRVTQAAPVVP